jgi:hypothetical protein
MFERPGGGEKAVLVQLDFGQGDVPERLDELKLLAASAGAAAVLWCRGDASVPTRRSSPARARWPRSPRPSAPPAPTSPSSTTNLSAAQQRNLEKELGCRVVDRASLILDIFAQRAKQPRGQAAGRTGAVAAPGHPAGARLDPPRAAKGRHRPARPGRDPAGDRPAPARQAGQGAEGSPQAARAPARRAAPREDPARHAGGLAGRLYQCRQVDPVQRPDQGRGLCRRPAVRHPRHHLAAACIWKAAGRSSFPTPSVSSATCRTPWWRPSMPPWRKRLQPICCCTWWIRPAPIVMRR